MPGGGISHGFSRFVTFGGSTYLFCMGFPKGGLLPLRQFCSGGGIYPFYETVGKGVLLLPNFTNKILDSSGLNIG